MKKLIFLLLTMFALASYSQALKQKSLPELERDLKKIDESIETTIKRIKTIRDATFLPDLYMVQAELYVDKSRFMYAAKVLRNKDVPLEELDFNNEKRPKLLAIETYQKLIEKFPKYRDRDKAMFFMAHEYREMGQLEDMINTYRKLTSEYPQSPYFAESLVIIGNYFFEEKKDLDGAETYFKRTLSVKDSPFTSIARYKLGWININKGRFVDALLSFEAVLTKDTNLDLSQLPEIYRKTDVRTDALVNMAWPYSEIAPAALKKMGEGREDPIEYFKRLSKDKISYQKALARLGRRLGIKQRYVASTRIYFELLKTTKNIELRIEAVERLYEAMKNSLKEWPVYGFTELIADTMNQIRFSPEVPEKMKFQHNKNFEIFARDAATRSQVRAKQTNKEQDFRLAISAYKAYLWAFPSTPHTDAIQLNLAESYFNIKDYVNAGKEYEILAKRTRTLVKRKSLLNSSLESFTNALKNQDILKRSELIQARNGLRDMGRYFVKNFPNDTSVPSITFNIGRTYYDERDFKNAELFLMQYISRYPAGRDVGLAVDLILDSYNQREDFKGLQVVGNKIIANKSVAQAIRNNVSEVIKQAEFRKIQTNITDFSSENYSKELLKFAQKYKGTNLGDRALFEAFSSLKAKKDPGAYIPGEELLLRHSNSQYAKQVTLEMGKMALLTADFRRASKYFEIFSSKYPNDSESKQLLKNAAQMRESMGDLELARKNYDRLGDVVSAARADFMANKWSELLGSAKRVSGIRGTYYYGLAAYRTGRMSEAQNYLSQTARAKGSTFEEKTWSAHALYLLSMGAMKRYKSIQLEAGKEAQAVQAKTQSLQALSNQLNQVIKSGNGRWTIAALYGLGQVNKEFSDFIKRAPVPVGLTPQQVQQYKNAIQQQASQYEQTAQKFFTQCEKNAEQFEVFTNFVKGCQSKGQILVDEESETQVLVQSAETTPPSVYGIRKQLFDRSRDPDILLKLAQAYAEGRDYSMSAIICDRILEVAPQYSPALALKGVNYLFMNNLELAYNSFKGALKINPGQSTALWGVAGLYKEFGFRAKLSSANEKARRAGNPMQPIHPFVRNIRI